MEFSEEQVYLIGAVLALIVTTLLCMPFGRYNLKWFWSHKRVGTFKEAVVEAAVALGITIFSFYVFRRFFTYSSVILVIGVGAILGCAALAFYLYPVNRRYYQEYSSLFQDDWSQLSGHKINGIVYYLLNVFLFIFIGAGMGGVGFARWVMPDVVEVQNGPKRAWYGYKVRNYYVLPYENGMKPFASYIDNQSKDTIYRVVVNYGYIGEDKYNYYTVNAKYSPHSMSRMPHHEIHVMDTIAPVMPASYNKKKGERYHTQRIYLTDLEHLWDFKILRPKKFGIERNIWVDSIRETKNRVLKEDYEEYRAYKKIDSLPYLRLRPMSEKLKKEEKKE